MPLSAMHWILASDEPSFSSMNEKSLLSRLVLTQPLMVMACWASSVVLLRAFLMSVRMLRLLTWWGM